MTIHLWLLKREYSLAGCTFKYNRVLLPPPENFSRRPAHSPQAQSRCKRLAGLLTYLALRCLPRGHAPSDNMMSHEHCEIHSSGNCSGFTPDSLLISVESADSREPMLVQRYKKIMRTTKAIRTIFFVSSYQTRLLCRYARPRNAHLRLGKLRFLGTL